MDAWNPLPTYPRAMPSWTRYRYCPMCTEELGSATDHEGITRTCCAGCDWTYYPGNVLGVNIVAVTEDGKIAMLLPPGEPEHATAALPGGVVEYGESPEQAAVRETFEETGLEVEIVDLLGHWFDPDFPYGPMVSFMFQAVVTGGALRSGPEGQARLYEQGHEPAIAPNRQGSRRTYHAYQRRSSP